MRRRFEVYPREGKSARAYHEKTCREAGFFAVRRGFEVYPRKGKSARAYHKKPCSFNGYRVFLRRCSCKKLGAIQAAFGYKMPCDVAPKTNLPRFGNTQAPGFCGISRIKVQPATAKIAAPSRLSQRHIQRHHHAETDSKENCSEVGVLSLGHFGDQLLHHNIEHGTGCKA